ncbi:MAG: CYTH domain-containing protein [Cytophagales bacterium]|nr:CYTH domain-containing protein [Cytophagales bacterium]
MALEIERKFLVKNDKWKSNTTRTHAMKQGYLNSHPERTVRVRIYDGQGILTIKGKSENLTRKEYEYDIPDYEAVSLLELCEKPLIEKTRHLCQYHGHVWEVDVFEGDNKGLVLAEIELTREDEDFSIPEWAGEEVSTDPRYFNSALIKEPFSKW